MPLPGGAADKIGNRFEGYWTVDRILDILTEKLDSIRLEPVGTEGKGIEFFVKNGDIKEYHQVKRQRTEGQWSITDLTNVLNNFLEKLKDDKVTCIFVSTISSAELEDLTDRSRDASSYEEFKRYFVTSKTLKSLFNDICAIWSDLTHEEAYNSLRRIYVETISERKLRKDILNRLESLVIGEPNLARAALFEYIFNNVHHELTEYIIWKYLESLDIHPQNWYKDFSVLERLNVVNNGYKRRLNFSVDHIISLDSPKEIVNIIESKSIILTGSAGAGKSIVLLQTLDELERKNIPFLVLDADNVEIARSARELGENLRLPSSPVNVLENIAQGKKCVLIIDQLDNVSLVPSVRPQFFDCIHEIVENVKLYENMSLILSCRSFDLKNDDRLIKLLNEFDIEEYQIKGFSLEQVKDFIKYLDLDISLFTYSQLQLLTTPIHLKLFSDIIKSTDSIYQSFNSTMDLFKKYWKVKKKDINRRLGHPIHWNEVVDVLCEYMANNQTLYVHENILDDYDYLEDAEAMASEGVLILDSDKYSFFHRNFFDYAFARRFIANKKDMIEFLTDSEQHLSRRSQVRQILLYKRDWDFTGYLRDLKSLLNNSDVRFHIQKLVFELLSGFNDPRNEEWDIIWPFISDKSSNYYDSSWRSIYGSLDWFELLDSNGIFENIMEKNNDYLIDKIMWIFFGILKKTDRVAELIEPYVDKSPEWNQKIINTIIWADLSREIYFKLVLRLLDEGIFENVYKDRDYWRDINYRMINKLDKTHPERSIEVISHYIKRKLKLALDSGQKNPFRDNLIPIGTFNDGDFGNLAKKSPKEFVDTILPIMLFLMGLNAYNEFKIPFKDTIWGFGNYMAERYGADDIILHSMEIALSELARNDRKAFENWEYIMEISNCETAHYLLVRVYTINRSKFSSKAVNYLHDNPKSLEIGCNDSFAGASMSLIKHISPHCTYFEFKKLEKILISYFEHKYPIYKWVYTFYPNYYEDFYRYEYRQADIQLNILKSIRVSLRSMNIRSRIKELSEMFGVYYNKPTKMKIIKVSSPIDEKDASQFNDQEWLDAISEYNKDKDTLEGGAYELSGVLEGLVKNDPDRFARLTLKFPEDTNIHYFEAILRGIADSNADIDSVINVCKYCHELPDKPCGRWITQPIANFAKEKLPEDILEIVTWYAVNDHNPSEELWKSNNSRKMVYYGGNIHDAGLNSVRGMVAESIGRMVYYNKDLIDYFIPTLNKMVQDNSIAVRSRVARTLIMVWAHNKSLALELFDRLIDTEDILLKTPYVEQFLHYNLKNNFEDVTDIINKMIMSENRDVNEIGAKVISYASLIFGNKLPQLDFSLYLSEMHRLGVAKAFADYLPYASTSLIVDILSILFDDPSENVREAAYRCFFKLNNGNIHNYINLIRNFIYNEHSCSFMNLVYTLEDLDELPDITIEVCEQFLKMVGLKASDIRTGSSGTAGIVADLIFKIYGQTNSKKISKRCLDLIDHMLEINVLGIESDLSEYEDNLISN